MFFLHNFPKKIKTLFFLVTCLNTHFVLANNYANNTLNTNEVNQQKSDTKQAWANNKSYSANSGVDHDNWEDDSDDWADDWDSEEPMSSPWQFTGFLETAYGHFLQNNIVNNTASLHEFRARVNLDYSHQLFEFSAKTDAYYDAVLNRTLWHTQALNISVSPFNFVDVKIGRQVLTWGTGDYLFLNDLFTKDWQSFFSGRSDEYLKAPSDSIRTNWYFDKVNFTLIWTPKFTPDHYITGERFSFYSPMAQQIVAPTKAFSVDNVNDGEWSARLNTHINDIEVSLYGYQGFWPTPAIKSANVSEKAPVNKAEKISGENSIAISQENLGYFPTLNAWGFSALTAYKGGIINVEYSNYHVRENVAKNTSNAIKSDSVQKNLNQMNAINSQYRLLIGYERELAKDFTAGIQYYLERTKKYQVLINNSVDSEKFFHENRQLLTLRLTYQTKQQTLTYSLFGFYSPTDNDAYLKPSIRYQYNDQWLFSAGANLFLGKNDYSFFGQHQHNSNSWLSVRFQY